VKHISGEQVDRLRQAMRMVVRELGLLSEAYFDIGVTLAERHLLIELQSVPQLTVGDIAERLLLDKSSASRLIAKAAKKGFVAYSRDAKDKRKRWLKITAPGRKTLAAFEPFAQKQVVDALKTLSEEEVKLVYQGVSLFSRGLTEARMRKNGVL
jgi:putative acetyltransferase